ncbi:MAG: phosphoadenylyl-sulfate reductase [Phaeodactylibacter sp.]|nr:phosphoadenylyl-sulfate reductase [Phaeodactylibacter sp.]
MISHTRMTQQLSKLDIDRLNEIFTPLTFEQRMRMLSRVFPMEDVLYTSSFGTRSVMLLHLVSRFRPTQPVHFINTTFHFKKTLEYRDQIAEDLNLNIIDVLPDPAQNEITATEQWWRSNPDVCCTVNKVLPLEPIKAKHKVWLTGLMAFQTGFRSSLDVFEMQDGIIKFNPLIDIDEGEWLYYVGMHDLPRHPLEALGFGSVGCEHCTTKGEGRSGRWKGKAKTECGLHPATAGNQVQERK